MEKHAWDVYWTGSESGVAFGAEGFTHPRLDEFWQQQIKRVSPDDVILDLASGRGALAPYFIEFSSLLSLDYSLAAMRSQKERHGHVIPIVGDLHRLALRDHSVDRVISQFGVEYGGYGALEQLPLLLRNHGSLHLLIHGADSMISRECRVNAQVIEKLTASGLIPLARTMFETGFAVLAGKSTPHSAGDAARAVQGVFQEMVQYVEKNGPDVAGGSVRELLEGIAKIQGSIQQYDASEVLGWLDAMEAEMPSYLERMQSMQNAAISKEQFGALIASYRKQGLRAVESVELKDANGYPICWSLVAADD